MWWERWFEVLECGGTWVQSPLRCGSLGSSQTVTNTTNAGANLGTFHTLTLPAVMHIVSCLLPCTTNHDQLRLVPGPSWSPQIQTSTIWLRYYQFNLFIPFSPKLIFRASLYCRNSSVLLVLVASDRWPEVRSTSLLVQNVTTLTSGGHLKMAYFSDCWTICSREPRSSVLHTININDENETCFCVYMQRVADMQS